ncbi:MAG: hypothetical protein FWD47_11385 [Treponema sp.]|nr:hypothetical protein [Treponema sp.]
MTAENTEKTEKEKARKNLEYKSFSAWILLISFMATIAILLVYFAEVDFSDETLHLLLLILRYSAFIVCVCSLYKLIINILRCIRYSDLSKLKKIFIFLLLTIYSIVIIFFSMFIAVISGGTG